MNKLLKLLLATSLTITLMQADGMIIVNSSVGQDTLSKDEVSKIFLGKHLSWADGSKINMGYQINTNSNTIFFNKIIGKKFKKFKKYWLKKVFSGNGTPPKTFDNSDKAVNFVKSTSGSISYIDVATAPAGVTVIMVDGDKSF